MFKDITNQTKEQVVGREREIELIIAGLMAGRHILLEGAPGTSKSTILQTIANHSNLSIHVLEGNADLTPAKLVGNFDPSLVLEHGMKPEFFIKGPLFTAMEEGGILYIDEFNRMASDASNTLIRAIEENEIIIPRYGIIKAHPNFRAILAQNPFDDVGVGRISRALFDRLIRVRMEYQSYDEELKIVFSEIDGIEVNHLPNNLVSIAVELSRTTRSHPQIKQGASIRGAIDIVKLFNSLKDISTNRSSYEILRDSCYASLSGKIWLDPSSEKKPEEIIEDLLFEILNKNKDFFDSAEDLDFLSKKKS